MKIRLLLAALLLPTLAHAHAILEDSTPPAGAAVTPGPLDLSLRYNSRIDRDRSRLTLIRPDRTKDTIPITPGGPPDIISAHLDLSPGAYIIRWQVLAVDGHITRGDVPLTVTQRNGTTPNGTPPNGTTPNGTPPNGTTPNGKTP